MKTITLWIICFLGPYLLHAQQLDTSFIKQVDSLIQVSRGLTAKKQFDEALKLNEMAEKIALETFGEESKAFGACCFNRGRVNYLKNEYPEAEKWYLLSKTIREKVLGKDHVDYATTLVNLALVYSTVGNFQKAEPIYLEAKEIFEIRLKNREHPFYLNCLNGLGILYMNMGDYVKAEPIYLETKALREKIQGKEHIDYASILQNLGSLYLVMGYYEKVEPLYLETMKIRGKALSKEDPEYARIVNNLGNFYYRIGHYEKAEPLYLEARAIREKLGKNNAEFCGSLVNLGNLYSEMGNKEKAVELYLEAKNIFEQRLNNRTHSFYMNCLQNLGILYQQNGYSEKAESLYLQTKDDLEREFGSEHPKLATTLNSLAILYHNLGKNEKAESLYLQSKAIREKTLGKEHPLYTESLNNLGNFYTAMGYYKRAEPLYLESKAIRKSVLGKGHPSYVISLNNLANLFEKQHRFWESNSLLAELFPLLQTQLLKSVSFLSERELANYNASLAVYGMNLYDYMFTRTQLPDRPQLDALPVLAYNHTLFQKGFVLNAASRLNTLATATPESLEINLKLKGYRRRLANEYAKPIAEQKNTAELEEKANIAEKELTRSVYGYAQALNQVKWEDVMSSLKNNEASIEFVSFKVNFPRPTDSLMYGALLLRKGISQPQFIPLFEEKSLDSLIQSKSERKADYVNSLYTLSDRGAVAVEAPKRSLYEILWQPLEKELSGIKTIYFSPSGLLHRINLDAVPVSETETLADRYNLIALNSTRQLVIPAQIKNENNDAMLYGGIQFEQDSTNLNNEPLIASRSRGELSFQLVDSTIRGGSWNYLAGTEREVNSIEKIMQSSGIQSNVKKGYAATEESFKNMGTNGSPSPRILHIATHGYFFNDIKKTVKNSGFGNQNEPVFKISDHPMLRSGLIMAGGNAAWQGKQTLEGKEDGVLTAYEISQMNLSNTELVVLSACETGLGDIQGNEGVYGLQRAFKIAGAKYLIMSLWQVPDKQTSLLMTTFYKKWLELKMTIPDAFHAAQKELRDNGLDPYNWAGFVLVE